MATLTLTIPTPVVTRVTNAVCTKYGYNAASGLTQQEFVRQWLITQLKNAIKDQEGNTAAASAVATNNSDVDNNINIT